MFKPSATSDNLTLALVLRFLGAGFESLSNVGRLAFAGLVLSVFVLVTVLSVVNGFEREMRTRVLSIIPHISVDFAAGVDAATQSRLAQAGPWSGMAPKSQASVLVVHEGRVQGALATGIDARYGEVSSLPDFIDPAAFKRMLDERFTIILGAGLAQQLGVAVGDRVRLVLPAGGVSAAGVVPRQRAMRVVGVYRSASVLDQQGLFMNLESANRLFKLAHPQGVHVRLADLFAVQPALDELYTRFDGRLRVRSWQDTYGNLYQAIAVQKATMFVLLLFLVSVAAFNLVSGLTMIVEQRRSDIAILQTLGFGARDLQVLFVLLGLGLAVSGIVLGLGSGALFAWLLPGLFAGLSGLFELNLMTQYFISYLPSEVRVGDLLAIGAIALVLALVATVWPARRAARTAPSEVLSHE